MSQLNKAKCHHLKNDLNSITDDELIAANRSVRDNQKPARKSVLRQRDFIKLNTERKLIKVNLSSMRQVIVFPQKDSKIARQIDSGVPIVVNDQCLIPSGDLGDIGTKRTKFNDKAKEAGLRPFGAESVRIKFHKFSRLFSLFEIQVNSNVCFWRRLVKLSWIVFLTSLNQRNTWSKKNLDPS